MFLNYLKITYRNLLKKKVYTSINVISLAIGLACSIFLLVYIQDELSYDKHHIDYEQIYRVQSFSNGAARSSTQVAFGDVLNKEYDDVLAARIHRNGSAIIKIKDPKEYIQKLKAHNTLNNFKNYFY